MRGKIQEGFGKYDAYISRPELIELSKPDPPDISLALREKFALKLEFLIGPDHANEVALGLGYLTGQKDSMPDEFNQKLRNVGLAHVVVASGFHLGLITSLAKRLFRKVSRFASYFAAIFAMIAFISITGFSASMLRAGLVTGMSLWASYYGRRFHPGRLLIFAAAISLLFNPHYLSDVAWQLSFASFVGLMFLAPLIQDYFFGEETGFISSTLIQTLSAQLFCLPISIYTFGGFSIIGIVSNFLIPPTIPLAMLLCFLAVIFKIALPARLLLSLHVGIVNYLDHFDWARMSLPSEDKRIFLVYPLIFLLCLFLKWRTRHNFRPLFTKPSAMEKSQKDGKIYSC